MKCPNCGKEMALQNNTWVCKECGCSMPAKDCRECPNCGDKMVLRRNALGGEESWVCTYCKFIMPLDGLPANNEDEEESDEESTEFQKSVMHCRFCGAPLVKRPDFCYECGAEQNAADEKQEPQTAICPKCGKALLINDGIYGLKEVCPGCGYEKHLDPEDDEAIAKSLKTSDNRCVHCRALLVEGQNFCPKCGAPQGRVCQKCGFALEQGQSFCPRCGKSVTVHQTSKHPGRVGYIVMAIIGATAAIIGLIMAAKAM